MFELVNPSHPDKVADRIAGAIVDLAYVKSQNPKIAVEVLLGHGKCHIIIETSETFKQQEIESIVERIAGKGFIVELDVVKQDPILSKNQEEEIRCGDNGIFKGLPLTTEEIVLEMIAYGLYDKYKCDGKYILNKINDLRTSKLIICQSNAKKEDIEEYMSQFKLTEGLHLEEDNFHLNPVLSEIIINPLGEWTGGTNVDTGATNRKLGSDMGFAVTGGGLHGKDLSKADVSVNIYAHLLANERNYDVTAYCAIGDKEVIFINNRGTEIQKVPYKDIVEKAANYIKLIGGFEELAKWGLHRHRENILKDEIFI